MENLLVYLIISLMFILNCFLIFTKGYSKEKGKNLATKEDIEEITTKIESVKLELAYYHSQKKELIENHKNGLLTFFEEYIIWYEHSIREISVVDNVFDVEKIRAKIQELGQQRTLVFKSFWKLTIFEIEDEKFTKVLKDILLETEKLNLLTQDFLLSMEQNSLKITKTSLTQTLANERSEIRNNFITNRDKIEEKTIHFPNVLMNIIRKKYLDLYENK